MKIAILSHKDVAGYYAATLMERGHEPLFFGRELDRENGAAGRRSDPKTAIKPEGSR